MVDFLVTALNEALQDEYKARATYRAIIERFGAVRPFANILTAEERHIQALLPLFARYGLAVPPDEWPARVEVPESLGQACQAGLQAEIDNGAMYERLLALTVAYPDVQQVFRQLQRASQQNHLPAFQRCVIREAHATGNTEYPGSPPTSHLRRDAAGCGPHSFWGSSIAVPRLTQRHRRGKRHHGGREHY
jgi:hypothetical protein